MISAVVAVDNNFGIGSKGSLLFHIPEDMKMFKKLTSGGIVIMGRKTYESLPSKPLPFRANIVVTSKDICNENVICKKIDQIKHLLKIQSMIENISTDTLPIYVIGGGMLYKELLPYCQRVYLTKVLESHNDVDTYFPNINHMSDWKCISTSKIKKYNNIQYQFCIYEKIKTKEIK